MTEEALFELAAVRAEQERDAGIRSASAALSMPGTIDCVSCGEEIPEARRSQTVRDQVHRVPEVLGNREVSPMTEWKEYLGFWLC